jgi:curved DNA-binding protein
MASALPMSLKDARAALGVDAQATASELRRAFREAAKQAHPDRPGGDAERFRGVVDAYHRLSAPAPTSFFQPPAVHPGAAPTLQIDALTACRGGVVSCIPGDGRLVRISLPAGLRSGDVVRAGGWELAVAVHGSPGLMVRGDDLWLNHEVDGRILAEGGRVTVTTPTGPRVLMVSKAAGERALVRIAGQGLPARGEHPQGHLFLRLVARRSEPASDAATLLRRFAAAWAA